MLCPQLASPDIRVQRTPTIDDVLPHIVSEGCGLRPARKGGIRLEVEWTEGVGGRGRVPIIHNYGWEVQVTSFNRLICSPECDIISHLHLGQTRRLWIPNVLGMCDQSFGLAGKSIGHNLKLVLIWPFWALHRVDLTESIKQLLCTLTRESLCPYLSSTSYGSSLKQLKLILYISQSFHGERWSWKHSEQNKKIYHAVLFIFVFSPECKPGLIWYRNS